MRTPQLIYAFVLVLLMAAFACKKDKIVPPPASITVVNALTTGNTIVPRFGTDTAGRYFQGPTSGYTLVNIGYGAFQEYSRVAGTTPLLIVPSTDTVFKIYNGSLDLKSGDIYSFFLSGDSTHADTLLVKDNLPYYADSSSGVRFVNLAVGGKALTINLQSSPGTTEFPALGYKQITDFKKYNAMASLGGSYTFDVRDQATGDSLTNFTWTFSLFDNSTIVIAGSTDPASTTPLNVFSVNHFPNP
jgi:hypothetical protein